MENDKNHQDLVASLDKSIESARKEFGENSTPVFAHTLNKYYELQKYSIFSNIVKIKEQFIANGGADKIVEKVQGSLIDFSGYEDSIEREIPFISSNVIDHINLTKETIIAASLYLLYVRSVIKLKYREVGSARTELVSALKKKNLAWENIDGLSPTDLKNKESELSRLFVLKKELKKIPQTFDYLGALPDINVDLKNYGDDIPEPFPNSEIYEVYLAASLGLGERDFEKFINLSPEDQYRYPSEIKLIFPQQSWKYWRDDIQDLFGPYFKGSD